MNFISAPQLSKIIWFILVKTLRPRVKVLFKLPFFSLQQVIQRFAYDSSRGPRGSLFVGSESDPVQSPVTGPKLPPKRFSIITCEYIKKV